MNIGQFKSINGRLMGEIATRTIDLPRLGLRVVESNHERAPVYEILALNVGNRWVQIGALWEAFSNSDGAAFLQGSIDDPSLSEPLSIALFGDETEGFRVAWRRQQPRDAFAPVSRSGGGMRRDERPMGDAGFGGSTAGDDGSLQQERSMEGAGAPIDDDIPF